MRTYIPPGYALIEWVWELVGMPRLMTTTLGCSVTATPTATTAGLVQGALFANWKARLPTSYRFKGTRLYIGDGTYAPAYVEFLANALGQNSNVDLLPPNVTHVVNKNTALAGRKGKGRMYIPGAKEAGVSNAGLHDAAGLATYNTALANLKTAVEATAGIGNLYLLGHSAAWGPYQITSLTMRSLVGTQVRRVRGP